MIARKSPRIAAIAWLVAAMATATSSGAIAGVVGDGTPASCTSVALQQQMNAGGRVTFNCGGSITIPISATLVADATKSVTIDGAGLVTLDGGRTKQIMRIPGGPGPYGVVAVHNLTFVRGVDTTSDIQGGGAIQNQGILVVEASTFDDNQAGLGGALFSARCNGAVGQPECAEASLTVRTSQFTRNVGFNSGGAISVNGDKLLVTTSAFSGNVGGFGGAISLNRFFGFTINATISGSSFDGNFANNTNGGGLNVGNLGATGKAIVSNSTFHANGAINGAGGGLFVGSATQLDHVTIAKNTAISGGGVQFLATSLQVKLGDSILASNTGGNCGFQGNGGFADGLKNLQFGDTTCTGVLVGDPKLSLLADNGGYTPTMSLLPGSAAIDAGDASTCLATDQRGVLRPQGAGCDLGALEYRGPLPQGSLQALWWARPPGSEAGWGINFAHQQNTIFATWFTYDQNGKPTWFIALLIQDFGTNVFYGEVYSVTGNPFNSEPFDPATIVETQVGGMSVVFSDNDNAVLTYIVNGVTRTIAIGRQLYAEPVPGCQWPSPIPLAQAVNFQDLWWAKPPGSQSGWGINFSHQGDVIFATWFTYGPDGKPLWFIVLANKSADKAYSGPVSTVTGPPFSAIPFDSSVIVETVIGNATITFDDGNNAVFDYTVNGIHQTKQITRQVFHEPGTICQ